MGRDAAGAYLWERRMLCRLSRQQVADRLGTSEKQIERIDQGQIDTRSSLLLGYARLVRANIRHLTNLLIDGQAPDIAAEWDDYDRLTSDQQRLVRDLIRALLRDE